MYIYIYIHIHVFMRVNIHIYHSRAEGQGRQGMGRVEVLRGFMRAGVIICLVVGVLRPAILAHPGLCFELRVFLPKALRRALCGLEVTFQVLAGEEGGCL